MSNMQTVILLTTTILLITSCATKASFQTSEVVPAARGSVKVKKDNNNNYEISIKISGLAETNRLDPKKQVYVVWMETDDKAIKNLGRITSSSGLLSKSLKATFENVTPFKPVKVFITAEDQADLSFPGSQIVLTTGRF